MTSSPPSSPENSLPFSSRSQDGHMYRYKSSSEVWNSFGFVEVGEARGDDGDYPMKRTKSSIFPESHEDYVPINYKSLENRIFVLQREMTSIKRKLESYEEDLMKTSKWGLKYSRRLTLLANTILGLWVFWSRFIRRIQSKKNKIIQNMMVPNAAHGDTFNSILHEAYIRAIAKSWFFFVAVICLTSVTAWKRNFGIGVSTLASAYPALKSHNPWPHYLNLASTALYIFAEWASWETKETNMKTLQDFIGPYPGNPDNQSSRFTFHGVLSSANSTAPATPKPGSSLLISGNRTSIEDLADTNQLHT